MLDIIKDCMLISVLMAGQDKCCFCSNGDCMTHDETLHVMVRYKNFICYFGVIGL